MKYGSKKEKKTTFKIYDFKENVTDIMKRSIKFDKGKEWGWTLGQSGCYKCKHV